MKNVESKKKSLKEIENLDIMDFLTYLGMDSFHTGGLNTTKELLSLASLSDKKHYKILDIGCGAGFTTRYLASTFSNSEVTGIDLSEEMINIAKNKSLNIPNIKFEVGDALNLNYADNHFDIVIIESVTNLLNNKERALSEYNRVTKPSGFIFDHETYIKDETSDEVKIKINNGFSQLLSGDIDVPTLSEWQNVIKSKMTNPKITYTENVANSQTFPLGKLIILNLKITYYNIISKTIRNKLTHFTNISKELNSYINSMGFLYFCCNKTYNDTIKQEKQKAEIS